MNSTKSFGVIFLIVLLVALTPAFTMWLWNWLMTDIFGLQTINYLQALGLMVLSSCFFYRSTK
jgi:hypothetical protein